MICLNCSQEFEGNFCPSCGTPAPRKLLCSSCGAEFEGCFCPQCGTRYIPPVQERCLNLVDKNGNPIDLNEIAGVYITVGELKRFFERFTNYSKDEIEEFSQYIYNNVAGNDYGVFKAAAIKSKIEAAARQTSPKTSSTRTIVHTLAGDQPMLVSQPQATSQPTTMASSQKPPTKHQRIKENKKNAVACCPKCGSTSLSANKKGFSFVKGAIGGGLGAVVAPVGIVMGLGAGNLGSKKLYVTCLNCGHHWKM